MNTLTILFGICVCAAVVYGRQFNDRVDTDVASDETDHIGKARDVAANQMRHRRRRWQSNYGYDYSPPPIPYYPDRREYDRPSQQQDIVPQILRLLDEISSYIKRPQPPPLPQPIYVPYPVPYPVPQQCTCSGRRNNNKSPTDIPTTFDNRIKPELEDERQNWGIIDSNAEREEGDYDDIGDGSRPISFEPIKPKRPMQRPPPKVEHGSSQGRNDLQLQASSNSNPEQGRAASICNGAILTCCNTSSQKQCFTRLGCAMTFAKGNACTQESVTTAIESFKLAYAPVY
ncbi:uncharacterized protein LOC131844814 [Achroia grisella]|uniref:uncharacterized protein LOC131844814 n=1 Tax=Achroia grisella TaxID=688607 RepID=UPI0027D2F47F|nr:uncharacterized protein LOC131844814 [Achroia grisella]